MSLNTLKKLFLSSLFLFLPLTVFAQSNRTQSVALVPFWGPDDTVILEFGEELFKAVNNLQGFRSVVIDMTNLPDDVPEGGNPPYICPSPSLIKSYPIALTGELSTDPDDDEWWHLRLYLWEMNETRLVFSDEVTAYDREEIAAGLNGGWLQWLFDWLKKGGRGTGGGDGEGDISNQFGGRQVFITTSMPLHWIYVGGRFGMSPLRMQGKTSEASFGPPKKDWHPDERHVLNEWQTLSGAITFSIAFFPESVPFFSRFGLQVEGIYTYDWHPLKTTTITPAALLKFQVYRHGSMLFSLFGGAYSPILPLGDTKDLIAYSSLFPIGWTVGLTFGGKLDPLPGIFYIDMRYSNDEFNTFVLADGEGFKRKDVTISVGYEFGFITKK